MPLSIRKFSKSHEIYSPPHLDIKVLIFSLISMSTKALKLLKVSKAYDLYLRNKVYIFHKKLSTNVIKYIDPYKDAKSKVLQRSKWTPSFLNVTLE